MKGVHVTSISTVVKEYTLVHTRHSSHPDVRVAASIKHDIRNGKAYVHKEKVEKPLVRRPSQRERDEAEERAERAAALAVASPGGGATPGPLPTARSTFGPPSTSAPTGAEAEGYFPDFTNHGGPSPSRPDALGANGPRNSTSSESSQLAPDIFAGGLDPVTATHVEAQAAYLAAREEQREVELGDGEVDTMISIPLPMWATPTHNVHPVFVTHKIKWSCVISNPDGHSACRTSSSPAPCGSPTDTFLRRRHCSLGAPLRAPDSRPLAPPGRGGPDGVGSHTCRPLQPSGRCRERPAARAAVVLEPRL
jgi:hypothetical protein